MRVRRWAVFVFATTLTTMLVGGICIWTLLLHKERHERSGLFRGSILALQHKGVVVCSPDQETWSVCMFDFSGSSLTGRELESFLEQTPEFKTSSIVVGPQHSVEDIALLRSKFGNYTNIYRPVE